MKKIIAEEYWYKENDDKFKCPDCGKISFTFDDDKLEGNLFCFYDECNVSIFMSASKFKERKNENN